MAHLRICTAVPWRRPRHELLALVIVGLAVLLPVQLTNVQDISRLTLSRAVLHGSVRTGPYGGLFGSDRAIYHGHVYSDKAPGMSFLALPAVAAVDLPAPRRWDNEADWRIWLIRVCTGGIGFLVLAWLVGRVAEGLHPGTGLPTIGAVGLGTIVGSMAGTTFGHVTAAALAFGAFVLVWRGGRRELVLAGLLAGLATVVEYQAFLLAALIAGYALVGRGTKALALLLAGAVAPAALLGLYDRAAFGSPLHLSYSYVANSFSADQQQGFFGIATPHVQALRAVLIGDRGLLVVSPVLALACVGLALVWRRGDRLEAIVCAVAFALLVVMNAGYFLPYGGTSPGPRFVIPALPFLALGLAAAFAAWPRLTAALTVASTIATTALTLSWSIVGAHHYRETVWGEIARVATAGTRSRLAEGVAKSVPSFAGVNRFGGAALVVLVTAAALIVCLEPLRRQPR